MFGYDRSSTEPHRETASMRGMRLLMPYGGWLTLIVGLLGLLALADMAVPYFLKLLFDDVFVGRNWNLVWIVLPGLVVVYVARNTLFYMSRMRAVRISEDLAFDLRKRLFEHLQRLSMSFYRSNRPGQVSARLMDDTFKIQAFIQDKLPSLLRYVLEFQVLLIIIYVVNWRLALASTIVLPLHFWVYRKFRGRIRRSHSEAQENLALAHGNIVEKFLGMEVVKGFSAEERETTEFQERIDASRRSQIRSHRFHFMQKVFADLAVGLGTVMLLGYGVWEVWHGRMTGGGFLMFFMYVRMLYPAVLEVISGAGHLSRASASVDRVFEMLEEPASEAGVAERGDGVIEMHALASGPIEYESVSFAYESGGPTVLSDIDFRIEPGEHVAITGPSGSGKSTLISLLPRFNSPSRGRVRINNRPTETISIRALRGLFGVVFQEVFLFNTSIYENLRYARPDATLEEMKEACRVTGAHEFIERLPDGYYTKIGSSGGELSRGEKQRITLARALVRDPQVLIVDEATASIDQIAAREIIGAILERMPDRTVIMVTHDTELLELMDRVISIEDGRVVFDDTPLAFLVADPPLKFRRQVSPPSRSMEPRDAHGPPRRRPRSSGGGLASLLALASLSVLMLNGCVQSSETSGSIMLEDPKIAGRGVIIDEPDPARLRQLADALDALEMTPAGIRRDGSPDAPAEVTITPLDDEPLDIPEQAVELSTQSPTRLSIGEAAAMIDDVSAPADSVRLIALPRLNGVELVELLESVALRLRVEQGYADGGSLIADALPPVPEGVTPAHLLVRHADGVTHVLRLGWRQYRSQPPQLWALGVVADEAGKLTVNPDLDVIEPAASQTIGSLDQMRENLTRGDLEAKLIQLSYVDSPRAIQMLQGMGVTAFGQTSDVPAEVVFDNLPYVVSVPDPEAADVGLIGEAAVAKGEFGISLTPSVASQLTANNVANPMTQLLVLFHPAHPEQFSRVRRLLDEFVDRPARQIFVEGMVLEISEEGLKDLGIEWTLDQPPVFWRFGSTSTEAGDTLDVQLDNLQIDRIFRRMVTWSDWTVKVRTLIRDGKAEVLARPSVLTLNNRQSTIRVGQDIPIATSTEGSFGGGRITFQFKYLPTGILLNVRPRIAEDGAEVSMLVDTVVSATVPGADLELRSVDGDLLASAPTVSTRRVQTYARIRNNTPFIVGGLVARQRATTLDKIPLLGDLPLLGGLFRAERTETSKDEVIIVLTPYVLPEQNYVARQLPKDEDAFDSFGHELFRDAYRIRTEDVFDLSFLFENQRLVAYRDLAREAISRNFRLAEQTPFSLFAGDRVPGEDILVTRMAYEVVKRLEIDEKITMSRVIYFEDEQAGGYDVRFIERTLGQLGNGADARAFFRNKPKKALALTYYYDRRSLEADRLSTEPIPEMYLIDCPDREAWGRLLWELNQPTADGRERYTILIKDGRDLTRLRRALALKRIVILNGGREQLLLRNFSIGKVLLMPELKPDQVHVIDAEVARYFFHTELYYAATFQALESALRELDAALRRPEVRSLLDQDLPAELESAPITE